MKKEMIIVILLLIIIFVLSFIIQKYTSNSVREITDTLDILSNNIEKNIKNDNKLNEDETVEKLKLMKNKWHSINHVMSFYLEHEELEKVNLLMATIKKSIEIEEYEEASKDIAECIFVLNHINEKTAFKMKNLF